MAALARPLFPGIQVKDIFRSGTTSRYTTQPELSCHRAMPRMQERQALPGPDYRPRCREHREAPGREPILFMCTGSVHILKTRPGGASKMRLMTGSLSFGVNHIAAPHARVHRSGRLDQIGAETVQGLLPTCSLPARRPEEITSILPVLAIIHGDFGLAVMLRSKVTVVTSPGARRRRPSRSDAGEHQPLPGRSAAWYTPWRGIFVFLGGEHARRCRARPAGTIIRAAFGGGEHGRTPPAGQMRRSRSRP